MDSSRTELVELTNMCMIYDGDKVLVQNRIKSWKGIAFPGGHVENHESIVDSVVREIKEELDTDIEVGDLLHTVEYDYPTFHLSMDCFWAEIVSGDLVLTEHAAAKWLTKDELDSVEWLPADVTLIEKIREGL